MLATVRHAIVLLTALVALCLLAAPARGQESATSSATPSATPPVSIFLERLAAGEAWAELSLIHI